MTDRQEDSNRRPKRQEPIGLVVATDDRESRDYAVDRVAPRDDLEVLGCAEDAVEATRLAVTLEPEIALLDVRFQEFTDAHRWITRTATEVTLVPLSFRDEEEEPTRPWPDSPTGSVTWSFYDFLHTVGVLREEPALMSPFIARTTLAALTRSGAATSRDHPLLSDRELEVLTLRARGMRKRELAEQLSISENTLKAHLRKIRTKTRSTVA